MSRNQFYDPYSGLADGIQQGLSTLANSQVQLAQISNDRQLRDRDYAQRLAEFKSNEGYRAKSMDIQQAQESREAEAYKIKAGDNARSRTAGYLAEVTDSKGNLDFSDKSKTDFVMTNLQREISTDPHAAELLGGIASARSKGKYDRVDIKQGPNGFVFEMYDSKDPSKRGVVTDNASMDPKDPVSQFSGENIIGLMDVADTLKNYGMRPSDAAYFLDPATLQIDEEKLQSAIAVRQQSVSVSGGNGQVPQTPVAVAPEQPPVAVQPVVPSVTPEVNPYVAEGQAAGSAFRNRLSAGIDSTVNAVTEKRASDLAPLRETNAGPDGARAHMQRLTGAVGGFFNPESDAPAPAPAPVQNTAPRAPTAAAGKPASVSPPGNGASGAEFSSYFSGAVTTKMAENEADRRSLKNALKGQQVRNSNLNRVLAVQVSSGGLTHGQAMQLAENGRSDELNLFKAAITAPSAADAAFAVMTRGGTGKAAEAEHKIYEDNNKSINGMIDFVNKGEKQGAYKVPPNAAQGVKDAMYMNGFIGPSELRDGLAKHGPSIQAALDKLPMATSRNPDRDPSAVLTGLVMTELRRVGAPANVDDAGAYEGVMLDLIQRYNSGSGVVTLKDRMEFYHDLVSNGGSAKVSLDELDKQFNELALTPAQ
jgi:hypothetical protein